MSSPGPDDMDVMPLPVDASPGPRGMRHASRSPSGAAPQTARDLAIFLVFFDWDGADLTVRARQTLAAAASRHSQARTTRIEVSSYTDLSGSVSYNGRLSHRRAENIAAELVRDGVSHDDIEMRGPGEVASGESVTPKQRRVQIILK